MLSVFFMSPHPPCRLPQVLTLISQVGTRRAVRPCLEGYRFTTTGLRLPLYNMLAQNSMLALRTRQA